MTVMRKRNDNGVFRITGARAGLQEDVRTRQRRYVISMSIRTVAVILTVVLWNVERPIAFVTLIVGLLLPYVAVVIANGGRENATRLPSTFVSAPTRPMITDGSTTPAPAAGEDACSAGDARADEAGAPAARHGSGTEAPDDRAAERCAQHPASTHTQSWGSAPGEQRRVTYL